MVFHRIDEFIMLNLVNALRFRIFIYSLSYSQQNFIFNRFNIYYLNLILFIMKFRSIQDCLIYNLYF